MVGSTVDGEAVVLAALLHDIGKFWQRTGRGVPAGYQGFGPADVGGHGAHARWSASCYEQVVPPAWRQGGHVVLYHHRPTSYAAKVLAVADHLAASEREDQDAEGDPRSARVLSVFGRIRLSDLPPGTDSAFPLEPLRLAHEVIYPRADQPPATTGEHAQLWDAFFAEASGLGRLESFPTYLTALLALLEKYTWCVPSAAYRSRPDVSLYDHARMTAALAGCLWHDGTEESVLDALRGDLGKGSSAADVHRFTLVGGDISGVQRFLYTIASRGAARTLRGRSLFLQLLGEAAADFVLRALDLPVTNLLYIGGAKFYILAPAGALDSLEELKRRLADVFLDIADGEIYLAVAGVPLSAADVASHFDKAWAAVSESLHRAKSHRLSEVARTHYARIFEPGGTGGPVSAGDACDVCGRDLETDETATVRAGVLRCMHCAGAARPNLVPLKICVVCHAEVSDGVR
ncbi:MAG TPA: type III-A CRISPR-associated protein Cas10/Csm1, partial [Chloroflexota bacterium]|nr:type III-A CRISPR-associated protein Cas10/Csm1 [Chloroflexota bacterium]